MDITKMIDNFEGSEDELKNIAQTVFECVDGSNVNDETFMDECKSMLSCDYDFLSRTQENEVVDFINELICNGGQFKRFFIFNYNGIVSVVGKFEDEGNLDMFSLDCVNKEDADYIAKELEPLVDFMNEQERLIKTNRNIYIL